GVYWCAFGTINDKVTAQGIVFPFGEVTAVNDSAIGTNDNVLVSHGQAWLMPETKEREILCYVTFNDLRKLKPGQQVQATPADLQRENWGYAFGSVEGIEQYPTTKDDVIRRLKLDPLAAFIKDGEAIYEVRVRLEEKDGQLVWSRAKSQGLKVNTGSLCNIQIITQQKPVWQVLIGAVDNAVESATGN
ncbi:MAG: hypothetical protein IKZ93_01495, partial [Prevotella sp.]|nr:hypothetical protein [Prevotella sp.]